MKMVILRAQIILIHFFTDSYINGGCWNYTSKSFDFNFNDVTFENNNNPTIEFDDCVGADFYCGLGVNNAHGYDHNSIIFVCLASFIIAYIIR